KFTFEINHEAKISLVLKDPESGIERTIASDQPYTKGEHSIAIPLSQLDSGYYRYLIKAESKLDGHIEEREGLVLVEIETGSSLPVGHAIEHNVDMFDGHLTFGRTDFSVQSRGTDLELQRFYSSNNRSHSAPFGPGWNQIL